MEEHRCFWPSEAPRTNHLNSTPREKHLLQKTTKLGPGPGPPNMEISQDNLLQRLVSASVSLELDETEEYPFFGGGGSGL